MHSSSTNPHLHHFVKREKMEGFVKYTMVLKKEISLITVFTDPFYFYVIVYVCVFYTFPPFLPVFLMYSKKNLIIRYIIIIRS